ncbi:hypothetical protein PsorP6_002823 [Peronosclerospora sorghi]|uniref:Uncharacterized protein n=1 Tax=Peronosclerospora sorghi TaxID=230839 RepID=A0ACC0VQR5_9STRA|nr:hypothetical protein PsorP6_002823 [Peronosclerospora sorghi]
MLRIYTTARIYWRPARVSRSFVTSTTLSHSFQSSFLPTLLPTVTSTRPRLRSRSLSLLVDPSNDLSSRLTVSVDQPLTEAEHESIVTRLKARCNALYDDNEAFVAPTEALCLWLSEVQTLQRQYASRQVSTEVARAYESGVAIASKQRQFELAAAFMQQMQQLGVRPTDRTHQYLIRNVALQLRSGRNHTSVDDLRIILKDVSDDKWGREIMSILEREERPIQLKTETEIALFHERLIAGVERQLDEYERLCAVHAHQDPTLKRSTGPCNEALRVYADNGVKFYRMLELMVARSLVADVHTYEALLLGARWNEIPATLSQFLNSKIVRGLTTSATATASQHVHKIWVNAMKAVVYSSTECFSSLSASVHKSDVDQLRKVFLYVDKQLSNAFPKFRFNTRTQYDDVYTIRAKAAAACGLVTPLQKILDEYVQHAPSRVDSEKPDLSKRPFLSALEIYPWALMELLLLSRGDVLARAEKRDVADSPRVLEMRHIYERVMDKLFTAHKTIDDIKQKLNTKDAKLNEDELRELLQQQHVAHMTVKQESGRAATLERRLDNVRALKADQVLIKEYMKRADNTVDYVLNKLLDVGYDVENDLDFSLKLMEQYLICAQRLEKRLTQRQKYVSPHMMRRVFKQVSMISEAVHSGGLDQRDPEVREKLSTFFEHAVCSAVRFWREEETTALVRQQQRLLGSQQLTQSEFDQLIFQRVTNLDVRGAHSLLQEMHNAGRKPSQEAIHRIALGVLHRLHASPREASFMSHFEEEEDGVDEDGADENNASEDPIVNADEALDSKLSDLLSVSDRDAIEDEMNLVDTLKLDGDENSSAENAATAPTLVLGSDAPETVEDLIGFFQDWYNLYGVKPVGKTVVPIFAQLMDSYNFAEFRRLLQILESMEGGLTPATELWLEKRLIQLGLNKTLDDFRLQK